jgi:hypothetical protein
LGRFWLLSAGVSHLPRNIGYFAVAAAFQAAVTDINMGAVAAFCHCAVARGGASKIFHAQRHAKYSAEVTLRKSCFAVLRTASFLTKINFLFMNEWT